MKRLILSVALFLAALAVTGGQAIARPAPGFNNHTHGWDHLWGHVLIDLYAIGIVFGAITVFFLLAYRRQRDDQEGDMPALGFGGSLAWALIPACLFMADDFYLAAQGWKLWNDQRNVPEDAMEIKVTASMYNWNFVYPNGKDIDVYPGGEDKFVVPAGKSVVVRGFSEDVVHSFFLVKYRIKEDVMPGRITYVWFHPEEGDEESILTCTEYCGSGHSNMWGHVKVVSEEEFKAWSES